MKGVNRQIIVAAGVGFFAPIFWGIAAFVLFNAPESTFTNVFWNLVHTTCPFWNLPGMAGMLLMPFLNAGLYALLWAGVGNLKRRLHAHTP